MRIRSLAVIGVFTALVMAAPAHAAITYTWNTTSGGTVNDSTSMTFGSTQNANDKAKVTAYQISSLSAGSSFSTATLAQYGGGLGVTSTNLNNANPETTNSPQHSMDNDVRQPPNCSNCGRYEFLLVEFDSANYKNMGFEIGWKQNDSDMQVWVGNAAAGLNLAGNNAACGGACDFTELGLLGFSQVQSFDNVAVNTTQSVGNGLTGRYLLIANRLVGGDTNKDYTKVSLLTATSVPEPSSLLLVAAAAAGVGYVGRKRRRA